MENFNLSEIIKKQAVESFYKLEKKFLELNNISEFIEQLVLPDGNKCFGFIRYNVKNEETYLFKSAMTDAIIQSIVKHGTTNDIANYIKNRSIKKDKVCYFDILILNLLVYSENKKTFFEKTKPLIFENNITDFVDGEVAIITEEKNRFLWIKEAFQYLDNKELIKELVSLTTIKKGLDYSCFNIKTDLFWSLKMYNNEFLYNEVLNNPEYHSLIAGDKQTGLVSSECINLIYQNCSFKDMKITNKLIADMSKLKRDFSKPEKPKKQLSFSLMFGAMNENVSIMDFYEYFESYQKNINPDAEIKNCFLSTFDNPVSSLIKKDNTFDIAVYDTLLEKMSNIMIKDDHYVGLKRLTALWLKNVSVNNIDKIININKKYNLWPLDSDSSFIIDGKESYNDAKVLLTKLEDFCPEIFQTALINNLENLNILVKENQERPQIILEMMKRTVDIFKNKKTFIKMTDTVSLLKASKYILKYYNEKQRDEVFYFIFQNLDKKVARIFSKRCERLLVKNKIKTAPGFNVFRIMLEKDILKNEMTDNNQLLNKKMKRI